MSDNPNPRRNLGRLVALAVLILTLAAGGTGATAVPRTASTAAEVKPTIVLVHGAWADGSSWAPVARRLQQDGYRVAVPANPLRGVASDARYIAAFLATVPGPIVLVGHSYGGMVITNAARANPAVKALVYVDAFVPALGESANQLAATGDSCLGGGGDPSKVFDVVPYPGAPPGDVDLYIKWAARAPYPGFARCFTGDLKPYRARVLQATQRAVALSALNEPSGTPAWATIRSWAVVGTGDRVIAPSTQLRMARRAGARITQLRAAHVSMLSHPDPVGDVIEDAAEATT
jgi:pimeloyl-ACP methyl ester carboxylesterase